MTPRAVRTTDRGCPGVSRAPDRRLQIRTRQALFSFQIATAGVPPRVAES